MLNTLTISELAARVARREISAREITRACLDRITAVDGRLHAFLSHDAADARRVAGRKEPGHLPGDLETDVPRSGQPELWSEL